MGVAPAHRTCNIRKHHKQVAAERRQAEQDSIDAKLRRGKHAIPGREAGDNPIPRSNPAAGDAR